MRKLILVGGPAGSGKSRFSEDLAESLGAVFLDKDTMSHAFSPKILSILGQASTDRESDVYQDKVAPLEYATLEALAVDNISLRTTDVICNAPFMEQFLDDAWLDRLEEIIKPFDAILVLVWMSTDADLAKTRLVSRNEARDNWKLANWDAHNEVTGYNPPATSKPLHVIENKTDDALVLESQLSTFVKNLVRLDEAHELIKSHA
ncbi:ATP-binding protein [Psychrobacter sp. UBA3480]|uniref:AAA family ATPase n=1 Tax=Psychrobacter sp. UBA3480 TaxID=1947350 RepID=UPI0025F58B6A|nr:ATP-binding protein [Psychrobacter sp. UBA3480]